MADNGEDSSDEALVSLKDEQSPEERRDIRAKYRTILEECKGENATRAYLWSNGARFAVLLRSACCSPRPPPRRRTCGAGRAVRCSRGAPRPPHRISSNVANEAASYVLFILALLTNVAKPAGSGSGGLCLPAGFDVAPTFLSATKRPFLSQVNFCRI